MLHHENEEVLLRWNLSLATFPEHLTGKGKNWTKESIGDTDKLMYLFKFCPTCFWKTEKKMALSSWNKGMSKKLN